MDQEKIERMLEFLQEFSITEQFGGNEANSHFLELVRKRLERVYEDLPTFELKWLFRAEIEHSIADLLMSEITSREKSVDLANIFLGYGKALEQIDDLADKKPDNHP